MKICRGNVKVKSVLNSTLYDTMTWLQFELDWWIEITENLIEVELTTFFVSVYIEMHKGTGQRKW